MDYHVEWMHCTSANKTQISPLSHRRQKQTQDEMPHGSFIYLFIYFSWHSVTPCTSKIPRDCSRLIKNISISVQQEIQITHFVCVCVPSGCILLENTERRLSPSPLSWLDWTVNTMNTESKTLAAGSPRMEIFFFMFCSIVIFLGKMKFFLQGKNSCGIAWVTFIHFFLLNIVISVNLSCFAL